MHLTQAALSHLTRLLDRSGHGGDGYVFSGCVGNCRGSVPLLQPAPMPPEGFLTITAEGLRFFIPPEYHDVMTTATMDYEGGLFGRGLNLTWPHRPGGCPNCS